MCDLDFHNKVTDLCINHFNSLPKTGKPNSNQWTVLSCIVLEKTSAKSLEVVALGTGSKCIGQDKMSPHGDILNDSHGEIICRRSFLRFIYDSMISSLQQGNSQEGTVLHFNSDKKKFVLRDGIAFHFFTTHVPCGDAAIFPRPTEDSNDEDEILPKRAKLNNEEGGDIFRTGAKCLPNESTGDLKQQGKNYHMTGLVRTKPGRGVSTLSLSCSDKIAKWLHLGLQGSLLSFFLEKPIYLDTVTIAAGNVFDEGALNRALYGRLGKVELEAPYGAARKVVLCQSKRSFEYGKNDDRVPCSASISWYKTIANKQICEVAVDGKKQGVTKKHLSSNKACLKICKLELFRQFVLLLKLCGIEGVCKDLTYSDGKKLGHGYQRAWSDLKSKNFRNWTSKNEILKQFCVT